MNLATGGDGVEPGGGRGRRARSLALGDTWAAAWAGAPAHDPPEACRKEGRGECGQGASLHLLPRTGGGGVNMACQETQVTWYRALPSGVVEAMLSSLAFSSGSEVYLASSEIMWVLGGGRGFNLKSQSHDMLNPMMKFDHTDTYS